METLKERIKGHEGYSPIPYLDTNDNWTIWYGHKLKGSPIPAEAEELLLKAAKITLDHDIAVAIEETWRLPPAFRKQLNEARAGVVTEMIFNMGRPNLMTFKRFIQAVIERRFDDAAFEMLVGKDPNKDSKWVEDVGKKRVIELAEIMRHGK